MPRTVIIDESNFLDYYCYTVHFRSSYGTIFMIFVVIIRYRNLRELIFKRLNTDTYLDILTSPYIESIFVRPVCLPSLCYICDSTVFSF